MSNCNIFSDPIILKNNCIDLDLPTSSEVVEELCSLIPASSQPSFNSSENHASDSQYSFIDDDVIPNDPPKCFERLEKCAPDSSFSHISPCMIFPDSHSNLKQTSPVYSFMTSQYLRPPAQNDDTSSLHDSLDEDDDKQTAVSTNSGCFFYTDGLFLPIDDDEFALVQPDLSDFGNNYTVQTGVNPNSNNTLCTHISPYHRSVSFNSGKQNKPVSYSLEPPRRNSDTCKISTLTNIYGTINPRSSTPEKTGNHQVFTYDTESDETISYGDTYSKNDQKEKLIPIFDNNGLFINKDNHLFLQKFSRKVFIGGLPRDISIELIESRFLSFGPLHVDWPNRDQEKTPPNGFAFLHFENYSSVEKLNEVVTNSKNRNKFSISSGNVRSKEVEVKFWRTIDCEYFVVEKEKIDPFLTVFVGALPRTTTAYELATFMQHAFPPVAYAAIDVDIVYGYPKGAGRVTFANKEALNMALKSHFVEMDVGHCGKKKRIEIKQFISNDQKCDICFSQRNHQLNKYCYSCGSFICETCENNKCLNGARHHMTTKPKIDTM